MKTNTLYTYSKASWHYTLISSTIIYGIAIGIIQRFSTHITDLANDKDALVKLLIFMSTFVFFKAIISDGFFFKKSLFRFNDHQARWRKNTFFSNNKWICEYKHVQHVSLRQNLLQRKLKIKTIRCHTPATTIVYRHFNEKDADQLFLHITTYIRDHTPKQTDCPQCS
jgi:membrane protein YdbS with pleckstrin-like domain